MMDEDVMYRCQRCGALTEWDFELGTEPLCNSCWDREVEQSYEVLVERCQSYEAKKELERECKRRYREANREQIRESKRRYCETHKEQIREYFRRYRAAHKLNLPVEGMLRNLTPERRIEIARKAANARWSKQGAGKL